MPLPNIYLNKGIYPHNGEEPFHCNTISNINNISQVYTARHKQNDYYAARLQTDSLVCTLIRSVLSHLLRCTWYRWGQCFGASVYAILIVSACQHKLG